MEDATAEVEDPLQARLADAGECEWVLAHRALSRLVRQRARADAEEGRWLLRARRAAAHVHMGCGSFVEYVERSFGYSARTTHDKLRVAEALEQLPTLAAALASGALCWSALRELTRVATPETEAAWLDVARGKLSRELEPIVASARRGELPDPSRNAGVRRHVLRFEVAPETYATFREAMVQLRRASDARIDDDAALLAMARAVLGGPHDDGRASYQLSLSVCSECGRGTQSAGGVVVAVGADVVDMMACDAQHIGPVGERDARLEPQRTPEAAERAPGAAERAPGADAPTPEAAELAAGEAAPTPAVERVAQDQRAHVLELTPAVERAAQDQRAHVLELAHGAELVAEDQHAHVLELAHVVELEAEARHTPAVERAPGASDGRALGSLTVPTSATAATPPSTFPRAHVGTRAKQSIPPALRRHVLHRDQQRCRVPGCQHSTYVDVHHIVPRSEGGRNTAANLIVLCGVHHRAAHAGALFIDGTADRLRVRHAEGSPYGQVADARALDVQAKVFSALRNLGFRETETRAVMETLRREAGAEPPDAQSLLRAAPQRIEPVRQRHVRPDR